MNEILQPLEKPRYIVIRKNWMKDKIGIYNIHSVPAIFDLNKKLAKIFYCNWEKFVGGSEFVFSRSARGKKLLLKTKMQNLKYVNNKNNTSKTEILWK